MRQLDVAGAQLWQWKSLFGGGPWARFLLAAVGVETTALGERLNVSATPPDALYYRDRALLTIGDTLGLQLDTGGLDRGLALAQRQAVLISQTMAAETRHALGHAAESYPACAQWFQ